MPCPHCQALTTPGDAYCISCGARLDGATGVTGAAPAAASASASSSVPALRTPRPGLRVALVVLVNLGLLAGSAYLVHALLQRYAAASRPAEAVRLGTPRLVASSRPPTDAAPGHIDAAGRPTPPVVAKDGRKLRPARPGTSPEASSLDAGTTTAAPPSPDGAVPADTGAGAGSGSGSAGSGSGSSGEADSAEQVRATLDADSVRMVVSHHMPQVRACYDRALKQQETIRGTVEVKFEVSAKGRVGSATVHRNTTGHAGLGACIANAIKGWRFPRPVGGDVTFIYPFVFSSGD
jgi:TonB family protein